jgi:hypothetical protein
MTAPDYLAITHKDRTDGNAAFLQPDFGFFDSGIHKFFHDHFPSDNCTTSSLFYELSIQESMWK